MILEVLFTSLLLQNVTKNICDITLDFEKDPSRIEAINRISDNGKDCLIYVLEMYLRTPVTEEEVAGILSLQQEDGSWKDIDYQDRKISQCEQTYHAARFQRLAVFHRLHPEREDVTRALHLAIRYWGSTMPVTRNWFYNQINIPKTFGPGFILFKDEMSPDEKDIAIKEMSRAVRSRNGQNLVWLSGNILMRAILEDDEELARQAAEWIHGELKISESEAGLQPDWSFLQHGRQLQFGNYGQSFVVSQAWWARALKGTGIDCPEEKLEILKDYIRYGVGRTIWGGLMDMNALGRQVFPDSQSSKALSLLYAMENLGLPEDFIESGPRYYPAADFGNYRAKSWYASIRMQSNRTIGYEEINNENQKGYFSSDGALLIRRDGDEYYNITPLWNWRHIPGTTTYDDGTELWGTHTNQPYNRSGKVFGKTSGDVMAVAMEYDRDSLKARKIWIFCPDAIICLGEGISTEREVKVETTVEQCLIKGRVSKKRRWVSHNGITYIPLGDTKFSVLPELHRGNWVCAAPYYTDDASGNLLEVVIDHGIKPNSGKYAYCIVPNGIKARKALRWSRKNINFDAGHISVGGTSFSIDWEKENISIGNFKKSTMSDRKITESEHLLCGAELPVKEIRPGLARQILGYNESIMQVKVIFGPEMVGQRPPLHKHPHTQSSYVVSGRFEFHMGDEVKILGPGDAYFVAPNVPHEAYCLEPGILIDGFSPAREDFLD